MILIKGKLYDVLKFIAQIALPALGTLYFTLAQIWGIGGAENVIGTIMAVDTFLGVLLGISSLNYNSAIGEGTLLVHENETGKKAVTLEFDDEPEKQIEGKNEVRFKVKKVKQTQN